MQIEIDFEVYKALTALRTSESDSYNAVVRRLLKLPDSFEKIAQALSGDQSPPIDSSGKIFGFSLHDLGAWFDGVFFPEGTKFRANYKGRTYTAKIENTRWVDENGATRSSPSDAAKAVCNGTNVNGWRFWHALRPGQEGWRRLDELRP